MGKVTRVGIDLAKKVFHVTAVDAAGAIVERKRLRRGGIAVVSCAAAPGLRRGDGSVRSAHHWGRLAARKWSPGAADEPAVRGALHQVEQERRHDADGIAEASARPTMRFVSVKSVEQQHIQHMHRARQLALRKPDCAEQSDSRHPARVRHRVAEGTRDGAQAAARGSGGCRERACNETRALLRELGDELRRLIERVSMFDAQLAATARRVPSCERLMTIPGVGVPTATALVAAVGDAGEFRNGRELAAWLGLVPRQRSTGGRPETARP